MFSCRQAAREVQTPSKAAWGAMTPAKGAGWPPGVLQDTELDPASLTVVHSTSSVLLLFVVITKWSNVLLGSVNTMRRVGCVNVCRMMLAGSVATFMLTTATISLNPHPSPSERQK